MRRSRSIVRELIEARYFAYVLYSSCDGGMFQALVTHTQTLIFLSNKRRVLAYTPIIIIITTAPVFIAGRYHTKETEGVRTLIAPGFSKFERGSDDFSAINSPRR